MNKYLLIIGSIFAITCTNCIEKPKRQILDPKLSTDNTDPSPNPNINTGGGSAILSVETGVVTPSKSSNSTVLSTALTADIGISSPIENPINIEEKCIGLIASIPVKEDKNATAKDLGAIISFKIDKRIEYNPEKTWTKVDAGSNLIGWVDSKYLDCRNMQVCTIKGVSQFLTMRKTAEKTADTINSGINEAQFKDGSSIFASEKITINDVIWYKVSKNYLASDGTKKNITGFTEGSYIACP